MKKIASRRLILLVVLLLWNPCFRAFGSDATFHPVIIGDATIMVEIADTIKKRSAGLQNRDSLDHDKGMLFIYDDEQYMNFWMKDTSIPLELAYINAQGRILEIITMIPDDHTIKRSREKAQYVLEVNQGWFRAHGIGVGDCIKNIDDFLGRNVLR
jgi:uncharacterized protein